jgi:hypothetical protein
MFRAPERYHLTMIFGGGEFLMELMDLIADDVAAFDTKWVEFCQYFNAPAAEYVYLSLFFSTGTLTSGLVSLPSMVATSTPTAALSSYTPNCRRMLVRALYVGPGLLNSWRRIGERLKNDSLKQAAWDMLNNNAVGVWPPVSLVNGTDVPEPVNEVRLSVVPILFLDL